MKKMVFGGIVALSAAGIIAASMFKFNKNKIYFVILIKYFILSICVSCICLGDQVYELFHQKSRIMLCKSGS